MSTAPPDGFDATTVLLWVARRTGALEALMTSAGTAEEVAAETTLTDRAARVLVGGLADAGIVERVDGTYEPTNRALGFLARRDLRSIGGRPHELDLLDRFLELPAAMRSGEVPGEPEGWTRNRLGTAAATDEATVRAIVTAAVREAPASARVLDVGGAPGHLAREFVARGHDVTVLDDGDAIEACQALLSPEPIDLLSGDPVEELPADFDLVFAAGMAHLLGPDANRDLVANAREALVDGGRLVLVDALRGDSPLAPAAALEALATSERGEVYDAPTVRTWLDDAGFERIDARTIPGTDLRAVVGRA
ncbi:MAG: SAM-dependent methyltransferase [Halobacteriales archaeon]|jgi:SAM-dependent methyltransferase